MFLEVINKIRVFLRKENKSIQLVLLIFIMLAGLYFRINGISDNHSFWADEAGTSSFARDIVTGKSPLIQGMMRVSYEPLQIGIISFFFKLLGISEYSARMPTALFGTLGIIFAYMLATKLSSKNGGLLAAFLFAFSQMNLANSTQAKPYSILTTLFLIICFLIVSNKKTKSTIVMYNVAILILLSVASFIHYLGVLFWTLYIIYIIISYHKIFLKRIINPFFAFTSFIVILLFIKLFHIDSSISNLFQHQNGKILFVFNSTMYLKNLLIRQYGVFIIPAVIACGILYKRNKAFVLGLFCFVSVLLFMWNFQSYTHNIRYLVPLFGIIFVLFGSFWDTVGKILLKKKSWVVVLSAGILLIISQYKIVLKPSPYYSPNADFYGDVQIADYKSTFKLIQLRYPNMNGIAIFNDVNDAQRWYLDKQADVYFIKGATTPYKNGIDGKIVYGSLSDFLNEKSKYNKGLLIVEDWESLLPEDIKQYAKKNMKLEIKVDGLKEAPGDPWPLEVYSWGMAKGTMNK